MADTTIYNNSRQGAQNLSQAANSIPDYNIWTKLAKASIKGVAEFYNSSSQRRQLEAESSSYEAQAKTARLNANVLNYAFGVNDAATRLAEYDVRLAQLDVFNTYLEGEYQAMEQGLQDAQIIANQRAQSSHSGVRMDSASKQEVDKSNLLGASINQSIIQQNTWSNARMAKAKVTEAQNNVMNIQSQKYDIQMQQANYLAQAVVAEGDAEASNIMAKSIKPLLNSVVAFGVSMGTSYLGGALGSMAGSSGSSMASSIQAGVSKFSYGSSVSKAASIVSSARGI